MESKTLDVNKERDNEGERKNQIGNLSMRNLTKQIWGLETELKYQLKSKKDSSDFIQIRKVL